MSVVEGLPHPVTYITIAGCEYGLHDTGWGRVGYTPELGLRIWKLHDGSARPLMGSDANGFLVMYFVEGADVGPKPWVVV